MSQDIEVVLAEQAWADASPGTQGLVREWHVRPGAKVRAGEPLVTVVVVKTSHEIVAPADGVLSAVLVGADATFNPGQSLATLSSA